MARRQPLDVDVRAQAYLAVDAVLDVPDLVPPQTNTGPLAPDHLVVPDSCSVRTAVDTCIHQCQAAALHRIGSSGWELKLATRVDVTLRYVLHYPEEIIEPSYHLGAKYTTGCISF